jgi:hypothetical protein
MPASILEADAKVKRVLAGFGMDCFHWKIGVFTRRASRWRPGLIIKPKAGHA